MFDWSRYSLQFSRQGSGRPCFQEAWFEASAISVPNNWQLSFLMSVGNHENCLVNMQFEPINTESTIDVGETAEFVVQLTFYQRCPTTTFTLRQNAMPKHPTISLDILPSDCPNLFTVNKKGKGRLPMAILGTEHFDVYEINLDSISIVSRGGTVFPVRTPQIEDVSTLNSNEQCECQIDVADGYGDLIIHFSRREVILALGLDQIEPTTVIPIPIVVEGSLLDGTPFKAMDCVTLVERED